MGYLGSIGLSTAHKPAIDERRTASRINPEVTTPITGNQSADRQETESTEPEATYPNRKDHPMQHPLAILAEKRKEDSTRQTSQAPSAPRAQNPLRATRTCNTVADVYM